MNCSSPGSFVHRILQARILEWVTMPTSRGSSQSRDPTHIFCGSCIAGRFFTAEPLGKTQIILTAAAAKSLQSCLTVRPHRWQPTRLHRPWDCPGKNTGVDCHFLLQCTKVKSESEVAQSCPTVSDHMDCSLPGSSVHGIFQARVLE